MICRLSLFTVLSAVATSSAGDSHAPATSQPRIAIVGAGAAGTSAAFWLGKARERGAPNFVVDVYEQNDYVGGRSTIVYPHNDTSLPPIELGASIFVPGNLNMNRAVDEFNLERTGFGVPDAVTGLWDGKTVVLEEGGAVGTDAVVERYGVTSIENADVPVQEVIDAIGTLYAPTRPVWNTTHSLVCTLNLTEIVSSTGSKFFPTRNVSKLYIDELIEGISRANYNQDVDKMHALGSLVSLATSGASSVAAGNRQVFEAFVNASGASLLLNSKVHAIGQDRRSEQWLVTSSSGTRAYDAVVLAAPYHLSSITLPPTVSASIPPQPYLQVHVTLLTTTSPTPNATFLGVANASDAPSSILITLNATRGFNAPVFSQVAYLSTLNGTGPDGEDEFVVKLFSERQLDDAFLNKLFDEQISWTLRHTWDAFPVLTPTTTFPPVRLADGLFYVNALEPVVSTMETETIASRNVVDLLLTEKFSSGICPPETRQTSNTSDYVYGWDC